MKLIWPKGKSEKPKIEETIKIEKDINPTNRPNISLERQEFKLKGSTLYLLYLILWLFICYILLR